jgi:choline dehydrogenase-like flavoprotein
MTPLIYDVCVIGSGPAGGVLSKELAEAGAKVALVEAGREMTADDYHFHAWPYELPRRRKPTPFYPPEVTQAIRYENCDDVFMDRIRAVGGRSIHWNAVCLRFAERDFGERSLAGIEEDWPLTYQELAPFYSYVEKMIGVTGTREGLEIVPDGEYLPPLSFRCSEAIVKRACERIGIQMIPARKALLTVPFDGRPPCHYCNHCMEVCDVGAIFTVPNSMIPKAQKTGNFTLLANRLARELLVDREGRVRAVSVVHTVSRKEEEIRAKTFAVCCASVESARLLLNSRSSQHPNGLANSRDLVGRYLTGHVNSETLGYLEELVGTQPVNTDGATDHSYIPRFNLDRKKRDYVGGYQYQMQYSSSMVPYHAKHVKGFGGPFKNQVRFLQPGFFVIGGWGKVIARPDNRVIVDPKHPDAYGIPIPVIHFRFGDNDRALFKEMKEKEEEILHNAGVRFMVTPGQEPSGFASHETGTARMGNEPRTSVVNRFNQAHEVKNLFVVDGSCFTTFPEKNPTLTIMALAVRAARYMSSEVRKGNLSEPSWVVHR